MVIAITTAVNHITCLKNGFTAGGFQACRRAVVIRYSSPSCPVLFLSLMSPVSHVSRPDRGGGGDREVAPCHTVRPVVNFATWISARDKR